MKYPDNSLVSYSIYREEIIEKEEARKVAREQYNRANRLERLLDEEIRRRNLWMEIARKGFRTTVKMGGERDELQQQRDELSEEIKQCNQCELYADRRRLKVLELRIKNAELVAALKEIGEYDKVVPDSVPLGVLLIIDRALINYREK